MPMIPVYAFVMIVVIFFLASAINIVITRDNVTIRGQCAV